MYDISLKTVRTHSFKTKQKVAIRVGQLPTFTGAEAPTIMGLGVFHF